MCEGELVINFSFRGYCTPSPGEGLLALLVSMQRAEYKIRLGTCLFNDVRASRRTY